MHVNEICKCIKSNSGHIRILNMSKNKLGDEGIGHVMKALCESQIEQVNLQSNKLTEKSVELIVGVLKTNKSLKSLDLQGNAITSRLMKNKLKNGLTQMEVLV
jgi:Ran GTPase-activating protein (RanGAP) involved in mRNA processing and transport